MIKLTITSEVLNESAKREIKRLSSSSLDEDGRDADWYKDMGMPVPSGLIDKEAEELIDDIMEDKSNFDKMEDVMYVLPSLIEIIVAGDDKEDTTIYLTSNKTFNVKESAEEVYEIINKYKL